MCHKIALPFVTLNIDCGILLDFIPHKLSKSYDSDANANPSARMHFDV
jgi:hypothetical protein